MIRPLFISILKLFGLYKEPGDLDYAYLGMLLGFFPIVIIYYTALLLWDYKALMNTLRNDLYIITKGNKGKRFS